MDTFDTEHGEKEYEIEPANEKSSITEDTQTPAKKKESEVKTTTGILQSHPTLHTQVRKNHAENTVNLIGKICAGIKAPTSLSCRIRETLR